MAKPKRGRAKYSKPVKKKRTIKGNGEGFVDKKRKNFRFIQRGKEMVDTHRQQKIIEDKYRTQSRPILNNQLGEVLDFDNDVSENEEEQENPFDELITVLDTAKDEKVNISDDEEENMDDDDSIEEDLDDEEELVEEESYLLGNEDMLEEGIEENDDIEENYGEQPDGENSKIEGRNKIENDHNDNGEEDEDYDEEVDIVAKESNLFSCHFDYELPSKHVEELLSNVKNVKRSCLKWDTIGNVNVEIVTAELEDTERTLGDGEKLTNPQIKEPSVTMINTTVDLKALNIKSGLCSNISIPLTSLQSELFAILNNYQDLFFPNRSLDNGDEIRSIYCLHALNHMLKSRARILNHSAKITAASKKSKKTFIIPDSYRDQGLVRPKILFVVPVRDAAYQIINRIASLMYGQKLEESKTNGTIINYERFKQEYTGDTIHFPKTNPKPEDYEKTFSGNTDDNFRIGISLTKKCIKLYTEFYASDILIASPLGLRTIIGAEGSSDRDYDFLNSIEILIIDQAELILAQNWENLLHIMDHLHLQPQSLRNTDFQRVRPWCLSGLSHFYRQTILFSTHELSEFRSFFSNKCSNYRGKVRITNPILLGDIRNVILRIPQIFHRINVTSLENSFDERFKYFITDILPRFRAPSFAHCMIYIPSYFDYVRLRNYFKSETINFVQICEYSKDAKIARARDMFYHSGAHFMLYSERAHFFRRTRIKGIRHLIMYQPPMWPHFYAELINLMQDANQNARDGLDDSMSINVLYTKFDLMQLNGILGSEKTGKLLKSTKMSHEFSNQ